MGAGKEEDEGGLTPTEDDDAASVYFSRRQACCPSFTEGNLSVQQLPVCRAAAKPFWNKRARFYCGVFSLLRRPEKAKTALCP